MTCKKTISFVLKQYIKKVEQIDMNYIIDMNNIHKKI